MAAVLLTTSCSKDEDNNASQQPEKKGIPFAVKVDTKNSLSKIGFADDGTNVNISFSDNDVNSLKMSIYSKTKTVFMGGDEEPVLYGQLTLKSIDGVFEGTLSQIPYYGASPDDGEELLAIIQTYPTQQPTYTPKEGDEEDPSLHHVSNLSLEDILNNSAHQYEGTFKFDASTPITNEDEKDSPWYLPIPKFDEDHIPTVRLTDQMTFYEFYFPEVETIYMGTTMLYDDGTNVQEIDAAPLYHKIQLNDHKFWAFIFKEQNSGKLVIRESLDDMTDKTVLYSKSQKDMEPGVLYSVTRPAKN